MFRFIRMASHDKRPPAYPALDHLLHAYFGEDFDLSGNTVEAIVDCYMEESPVEHHRALREEIARFRLAHPNELDDAFLGSYKNFFNPPLWRHTTDSFLTEVDRLLREPGATPPSP
jgi:hypothetical protein